MREKNSISNVCLFFCYLVLMASCDQSFNPLQENDKYYFSIYGYLDASADTQWVRVGTVRQSIDDPPDPTGIRVTLKDVQSGETVVMKDSLLSNKFLNYLSTMDIKNEQTYRITVEGADGKTSWVTITTPKELPPIYIIINDSPPVGFYIYIDDTVEGNSYGVEHIADVQSVWHVILKTEDENQKKVYRFPLRNTLKYTSAYFGAYYAFANWEEEREQIEQSIIGDTEMFVASRQFFVAFGGPEWDGNISSFVDLEYFLDGTASNVENGLGYAVGISSGWYRQVTCLTPDSSSYIPCEPEDPYW